jgi:hypothetical protein
MVEPDRSIDVELAMFKREENKAFKVENMSIVIRIVGEQTNQFYTIRLTLGL